MMVESADKPRVPRHAHARQRTSCESFESDKDHSTKLGCTCSAEVKAQRDKNRPSCECGRKGEVRPLQLVCASPVLSVQERAQVSV